MGKSLLGVCENVDRLIRTKPEFAHTSHFLVAIDGQVIYDAHYRGPVVAEIFSLTKTVLSTLIGIAVRDGAIPDLDLPLDEVLDVSGTPASGQTLRHLLTMTRGSSTDGAWAIDKIVARPSGWIEHIAQAPQLDPPGTVFRYDNGASHLLSAALSRIVGQSLSEYAAQHLYRPLGITAWDHACDPAGFNLGFGGLRLSAHSLAALGTLWMDDGCWAGQQLIDRAYLADMLRAHSQGGPPEQQPYGYLTWIAENGYFAGGWAGQHVTVVPEARAVIVTTGEPRGDQGPPGDNEAPAPWLPAKRLVDSQIVPRLQNK